MSDSDCPVALEVHQNALLEMTRADKRIWNWIILNYYFFYKIYNSYSYS